MAVDLDKLTRPFPREAIKQRLVQGKQFDYVEGHVVIHRLNDATENVWSMEVKSISTIQINDDWKQVTAHVALTIPGLGTREHIGIQDVHVKGPDLVKGAITDALKKAATLFGVGLELYGPDYEAGEVPQQAPAPRPQNPLNAYGRSEQQAPPKASPNKPISEAQMRKIHVTAKEKGVSDDALHEYLDHVFGVAHKNDLNSAEASQTIEWLINMPNAPVRQQTISDLPEEPAHIRASFHHQ